MKYTHYVDLIDFTITTGKIHPFYKGFRNLKATKNYVKINLVVWLNRFIFVLEIHNMCIARRVHNNLKKQNERTI